MTALELDRKLDGKCTRCGEPAGDTNLCEPHRLDLNARVKKSLQQSRAAARLMRAGQRQRRRLLSLSTVAA